MAMAKAESDADPLAVEKQELKAAAREAKPWVARLARFGYAAKGLVYAILGGLALRAAVGMGGRTTSTEGVLQTIVNQPLGKVLLSVVAVGLCGYALWRLVQAFVDPEGRGLGMVAAAKRLGYTVSGAAYLGLALSALQLVLGLGQGGGASEDLWAARLLHLPLGRWLLAAAAAIALGVALNAFYVAYQGMFRDKLDMDEMSAALRTATNVAGRLGLAARGVVLCVIGLFLVQAALQFDASEAGGLEEALDALARQPYGAWLLGVIALGLVAYGAYAVLEARFRRIPL